MNLKNKLVLAYSGGLDTSYCAVHLSQDLDFEVHAVSVNTGGFTQNEIQSIVETQKTPKIFKAKTHFDFMGKSMRFSGFRTKWKPILWPKKSNNISTSQLNSKFTTLYLDFDSFSQQTTQIAKRKAFSLYSKKVKPNMIDFIWKPFWTLKKECVFNLCILDGKQGFILAYLRAFMQLKTYLFLWLNYRNLE